MPLPDATLPDATLPDATLPDATLPDATRSDTTPFDTTPFDAVLFDLDGVVTDTAALHAAAWAALFDEVLPELVDPPGPRFDPVADYRRMVDGRSREDGVRSVLADRGLTVAEGSPGDAASQRTVHGLLARKQELFAAVVAQRGVVAFPSTVSLLRRLRAQGIRTALVTSSRNSSAILVAAGVAGLFDTVVDGTDAVRLGLAGKPDPATFLEGTRRLGIDDQIVDRGGHHGRARGDRCDHHHGGDRGLDVDAAILRRGHAVHGRNLGQARNLFAVF